MRLRSGVKGLLRNRILMVVILLALLPGAMSEARDFRVRKSAGDFTVEATLDRNPPVLGYCNIRVEIRDRGGAAVTAARVMINYYMPPMPGMVPMNYTIDAAPRGKGYEARMNFIMTGPWNIVIIASTGSRPWRVVIPIDVR